jgi:hypothetical protein
VPGSTAAASRASPRSRKDGVGLEAPLPALAEAEEAEAVHIAGHLFDVPRPGHVGLTGRRRLVALSDALEEGSGKSVGEGRVE